MHLLCADTKCDAEMTHRKEGLTHGSMTLRDACFVSKDAKAHRTGCTAHEDLRIRAARAKNIAEGLEKGHSVVININMSLQDAFNDNVRKGSIIGRSVRKAIGPYVAVPAKTIDDLLHYKNTIIEHAGQAGLDRTHVNYKGNLVKINDFILDSPEKFRAIVDKMFLTLQTDSTKLEEKSFPRLLAFKATKPPKESKDALVGSPVTLPRHDGKKLVLVQKLDADKKIAKALRGDKVLLIAEPQLLRENVVAALDQLSAGNDNMVFLDMKWKVTGAHQFTPADIDVPRPAQSAFKF